MNDRIQAINGVATDRLTHSEVLSLLKSAGTVINLEVSYETLSNYGKFIYLLTYVVIIYSC